MEAVLFIACYPHANPVSSKEIAEHQNLPPRYLEQIMQKLVKAKILRGVRGPRGGYLLARDKRHITLADLYHVIREEELPVQPERGSLGEKVIAPLWRELHDASIELFASVNLLELCDRADKLDKDAECDDKKKNVDFTI